MNRSPLAHATTTHLTDWLHRLASRPAIAVAVAALILMAGGLQVGAQQRPLNYVYPQPGDVDVSPGASIQLRFDMEIDTATLEDALTVEPQTPGTWDFSNERFYYFRPLEPLAPETEYAVTIGTDLRYPSGRPVFDEPYEWRFTTGPYDEAVSFGGEIPFLYLDPDATRVVPLNPGYPRTTLEVVLYELEMPGLARRFADFEVGGTNDIDVQGLSEAHRWTTYVDAYDKAPDVVLPPDVGPGLYVIDVGGARLARGQAVMVVARHAIAARQGLDGLTAWVSTVPEGEPGAGADVTVHDAAGQPLATATTAADGLVGDLPAEDAAYLSARIGDEIAVVGLGPFWRSSSWWWWGWREVDIDAESATPDDVARYAGHIHTDRPIYRPEHTVHWKASLRALGRDGFEVVDASTPVTVSIRDAGNNLISRQGATTDEFGSIAGDLPLDTDAALGDWQIEVKVGDQSIHGRFQVEEYVKPDYEVNLETDEPWYVRGDRAELTVQADYYFGQPVADAEVVFRVYEYWSWRGENRPIYETTARTDDTGAASATVMLPDSISYRYGRTVWLEAQVTDASRRPVTGYTTARVYPAEFDLSLINDRYGNRVGEPVSLDVRTRDHDGQPVSGQRVEVDLRQYGRGGYDVLRSDGVTTDADGMATVTYEDLAPGWYSVQATTQDVRGNRLTTNSYLWVYDEERTWRWYGGLEVELDRDSYAPGDTAQVLIKSPMTTTALVTIERDEVYEERVVELNGAATIDIPVQPEYAPNVNVSVVMWQVDDNDYNRAEGRLIMASRRMEVPAEDRRLQVEVVPGSEQHRPGDEAQFTVRVTDSDGNPVRAQASLAVVDKAVLALASDTSGDIFDAFWRNWPSSVEGYDSLRPSQGYQGQPDLAEDGRGGGGPAPGSPSPEPTQPASAGEDEDETETTPRREFPDTALWRADLVTDENGEATVTMDVPDSLTTWVATARAITLDARAGQGKGEMVVSQPVIADIALPRFAVQGDRFALDVLGRNYAQQADLPASCELTAPGLTLLDGNQRDVDLQFNRTETARYSVVASELGTSPVTARLNTDDEDDAIELPLEIEPFTVPERFASAGTVEVAKVSERFDVPYNAEPGSSSVTLRLSPGVAQSVLDGVGELVGYPYGCVEQTMSRMLPNAVVGRLVDTLGVPLPEGGEDLPEYMDIGLQKLYGFQNPNGSWGWWHHSHSEGQVYLTAYVLHGLLLSRDAGYDIDQSALDRGFQWLLDSAKRSDGEDGGSSRTSDPRIRSYAAYVLTLGGLDGGAVAMDAFAQRDGFDPFALSALVMALDASGEDAMADAALADLLALAEETPTDVFWPMETEETEWGYRRWNWYQWRTMASAEKYTATALQAILSRNPDHELAPKAARWLLAHRHGRGWYTTHATAFAVLGLTDFVLGSGELEAAYDWAVDLDGRTIASGRVDETNVLEPIEPVVITGDDLLPGGHQLTMQRTGQGTLFYTLLGEMALYYDGFEAAEAEGLGVDLRREYIPVTGSGEPGDWRVGDIVNVRLTLESREDLGYMIIEDMLPAGFEPLNQRLETEGRIPGETPWRWWGYERRELRDERVTFFATWVPAGTRTYEYAARVITPGEFSARPAETYAMYRPEVWGRSASMRVMIHPDAVAERPDLAGDFDNDCRLTDFDAKLVAAEWDTPGTARDVNGDGRVSVADVAVANGRGQSALACGDAVPAIPPAAGSLDLTLREAGESADGDTLVELVADGDAPVGAWEASLALPDGVEIVDLLAGDRLPDALNLAPRRSDGTVRLGAWATADGRNGDVIARLTLRTTNGDGGAVRITAAEVTTADGSPYEVSVDGEVVSPPTPTGGRIWLPLVTRDAILR